MKTFVIAVYERDIDYYNNPNKPVDLIFKEAKSAKKALKIVSKEITGDYFLKEETERFSHNQNEDYKLRQQLEDEIKGQLYDCGCLSNSQKRILYSNIKFVIDLLLEEVGEDD